MTDFTLETRGYVSCASLLYSLYHVPPLMGCVAGVEDVMRLCQAGGLCGPVAMGDSLGWLRKEGVGGGGGGGTECTMPF